MQIIIQAVVLRSIVDEVSSFSLYTSVYGRLQVQDVRRGKQWERLVVGDVGNASLVLRGRKWVLDSFESVLTRAQHLNTESFYWRNHFLDMYFYYVPLEQPSAELFSLLLHILQLSTAPALLFKLCGAQFFALLGYYVPDSLRWYRQSLELFGTAMAERLPLEVLYFELKDEYISQGKQLDAWLLTTVMQHDHFRYLKTQQFLPQLYCITQGDMHESS